MNKKRAKRGFIFSTRRRLKIDQLRNQFFGDGDKDVSKVEDGTGTNIAAQNGSETAAPVRAGFVTTPAIAETTVAPGEAEARSLLKRTPDSYLFNQAYGLWFFIAWFFLILIITHEVSAEQYGIFAIALTAYNTILYIIAFGFEDATTTYIPRVFAEHGRASAALLMRKLLALRLGVLAVSVVIMLFALPALAMFIALMPFKGAAGVAASLRNPELLSHVIPIVVYVVGSSLNSLLNALCAALMRMRIVFVIGSVTQLVVLVVGFVVLRLGSGINGMLWLLAITSLLNAAAFAIWLAPFIFTRRVPKATGQIAPIYNQPLAPLLKLGISAWLTNLVTGALLKQLSIILLGIFAISVVEIGYFNLSYQLADSANLLLVAGFAGVSGSALAAAFVGRNYERLSRSWQALIKVETLLAAPVLVFCLFNAPNIAHALYGSKFDAVGPLLAIFLFFNILVRVLGTTIHQYALYVLNKARLVVLSFWVGMVAVALLGVLLIPRFGPAGALFADGVAKTITGALLLVFLWRDLPHKYPLNFTLRFLLALVLAALPSILWHPSDHILLALSGCLFLALCFGLLLWIKPLSSEDIMMIEGLNPRLVRYIRWFAQKQ
jgi:O-antigen/teichoic acid export membrane protein